MATAVGITLIKQMEYRGKQDEEWSNKYWLTGAPPADNTAWKALADQLAALERTCYGPTSKIVAAYGYNDNTPNAHSVWSYDYSILNEGLAGDLQPGGADERFSGDQAGFAWWKTARKNEKGKWVYLRKYFHDGFIDHQDVDRVTPTTIAAYTAFALALTNGTFQGRAIQSQRQQEVITEYNCSVWVTTRTLKRRGKRPQKTQPAGMAA